MDFECGFDHCDMAFTSIDLLKKHLYIQHLSHDTNYGYICKWKNCMENQNHEKKFGFISHLFSHIDSLYCDTKYVAEFRLNTEEYSFLRNLLEQDNKDLKMQIESLQGQMKLLKAFNYAVRKLLNSKQLG